MRDAFAELPPAWQASVLKAVVGGWTTERRMTQTDVPCKFGCTDAVDSQSHYLMCPALWAAISIAWYPE
eukprot:7274390-Pyramimonas_sp.AAC.1